MSTISQTKVDTAEGSDAEATDNRVVLKLRKPIKSQRHVAWHQDTVDNENLNRRKTKFCYVYVKPLKFGESSSDSEDEESEHCRDHVEPGQKGSALSGTVTTVEDSATGAAASTNTEIETVTSAPPQSASRGRVAWAADTVDNENMNKCKSKCCCIFEKQREFGESSSDSEVDDCPNCRGHKENSRNNADNPTDLVLGNPFVVHGDAS
ncbi:hypothetical protein V5799_021376 [Amblyomma americanum]|uniref:E3 ubiquitin-protein ligase PPP1R11 n=1 Tax=Amblyomma americanum TaxID=6943 RepID=A0AAQ4FQC3_AMBAM